MLDFSGLQPFALKKIVRSHKKSLIIQKGPRLFSFESVLTPQNFVISVKKLRLEKRPTSVYNVSSKAIHEPIRENEVRDFTEKFRLQQRKENKFLKVYKQESFHTDNPFQNERLKSPKRRSASQHRVNRLSP